MKSNYFIQMMLAAVIGGCLCGFIFPLPWSTILAMIWGGACGAYFYNKDKNEKQRY